MCDAEYIDKKQLKLNKLEKLLKRWDIIHYSTPYLENLSSWRCQCINTNEEKYKNKILFILDHKLGDGKKLIRNELIKLFTNELNKVATIKGTTNYGTWDCMIEENIGVFPYYDIVEREGCYTFTKFKKEIKEKIVYFVDEFMEQDHKTIAEYLSDNYGCYIKIRFRIIYTAVKEEDNGYGSDTEIKFTPDMFC